jgi:tetratricopeptide (TPR) repeat protein
VPEMNTSIGSAYLNIEYYQKALKYYKKALSLRSECNLIMSYENVLLTQGKYDEAIRILDSLCNINACEQKCDIMRFYSYIMQNELEKAEKYFNNAMDAGYKRLDDDDICIAYIYKETGRRKEALPILHNSIKRNENLLKTKVTLWDIQSSRLRLSIAYSILDENKKALYYLSELEKSGLFQGFFNVNPFNLKTFPGFNPLRNDPEFKAIVKRIDDQRAATRAKVREMEERGELHL